MKISEAEYSFLGAIDLHPLRPLPMLAKSLGLRTSRARYLLGKYVERGVIYQRVRVNFFRLGINDTAIFFTLTDISRAHRERFEQALSSDTRVAWFGSLAGQFQYGVIAFTKNLAELSDFFARLAALAGRALTQRVISPRLSFTQYQRAYLIQKSALKRRTVSMGVVLESRPIDELDHAILRAMTASDFASIRGVARTLGSPLSTIEDRISRLRQSGIIEGIFYELNVQPLGVSAFRVHVGLRSLPLDLERSIEKYCAEEPSITYLTRSLGSWDYEIGVEAREMREVTRVVATLSERTGQNLSVIEVLGEVRDIKWTFFP